jgi:hypothetical protein
MKMSLFEELTPKDVQKARELFAPYGGMMEELTARIAANTLKPTSLMYTIRPDEYSPYDGEDGDDWLVFEPNSYARGYARQIAINETYERFVDVGGGTPEEARQQVADLIDRFTRWQDDDNGWRFVWVELTAFGETDAHPGHLVELTSESLGGIESDMPYEQVVELLEDLKKQLAYSLESEGYAAGCLEGLVLEERKHKEGWWFENYPVAYNKTPITIAPLPELPPVEGITLRWDYDVRGRVVIRAVCDHCEVEFEEEFLFDTPQHRREANGVFMDMSQHGRGCDKFTREEWEALEDSRG